MRTGLTAWAGRPGDDPPAARCIHTLAGLVSLAALMCPNRSVPGKLTMTDQSRPPGRIASSHEPGGVTGQRSVQTLFGRKHRTFKAMGAKPFCRHSLKSGNTATFIARAVPTNVARKVIG
ncbi:hypothetical protein C9427_06660 [Mesorhizobium helmanticense]|uniref:Uncharacterized protein n=1 Tax=Mesorhizobium helmanticense TaxID=1776423 RepID=A0A2T4J009_9HYPH|nr:hypothetical protein C9427_06660 [Mesorhizobium helmanticense]